MQGSGQRDELSSFWDDLVACHDDLPKLLELISRRVAEVVGEGSVLTVLSDDGATLEPVASFHPDPEVRAHIRDVLASEPYRVGEGIAGQVAAERKLAVVNGLQRPALASLLQPPHRQRFQERYPIRALVVVPMIASGELVGTLGAMRIDSDEDYGHDDVVAMSALAERAALAIAASTRQPSPLQPDEYQAIYQHSPDGMLFTAPDGRVLAANPAACESLGMTEAEICRLGRANLLVTDDPRTARALAERATFGRARAELPMRRGNGSIFTADVSSSIFTTEAGEARACVVFRDISEQVAIREELDRHARELDELAQRDALTGMRNRRGFEPAAQEALAIAARDYVPLQLVFLDLDDLKSVNDTVGHRMGDVVLRRLATAIRAATRDADVGARLSGDEFVLLLFNATRADADRVVERIAETFADAPAGEPVAGFSVGVAERLPGETTTLDELVDRADEEMYADKVRRRFGSEHG